MPGAGTGRRGPQLAPRRPYVWGLGRPAVPGGCAGGVAGVLVGPARLAVALGPGRASASPRHAGGAFAHQGSGSLVRGASTRAARLRRSRFEKHARASVLRAPRVPARRGARGVARPGTVARRDAGRTPARWPGAGPDRQSSRLGLNQPFGRLDSVAATSSAALQSSAAAILSTSAKLGRAQ